jgi:hypothetical protein
MGTGLRILVANEPRAHREAHGGLLRARFPEIEVLIIHPNELEAELAHQAQQLVICSTLSAQVQERASAWVLLYPDLADLAVTSIGGQQSVVQQVSIEHLLHAVHETVRLLGPSGPATTRMAAEEAAVYDAAVAEPAVYDAAVAAGGS